MRILIATFLATMLIFGVGVASASIDIVDEKIDRIASHDFYPVSLTGKILDGVDTIAGAPLEMLEHPYRDLVVEKDYRLGWFTGLTKGLYHTVGTVNDGAKRVLESPLP